MKSNQNSLLGYGSLEAGRFRHLYRPVLNFLRLCVLTMRLVQSIVEYAHITSIKAMKYLHIFTNIKSGYEHPNYGPPM